MIRDPKKQFRIEKLPIVELDPTLTEGLEPDELDEFEGVSVQAFFEDHVGEPREPKPGLQRPEWLWVAVARGGQQDPTGEIVKASEGFFDVVEACYLTYGAMSMYDMEYEQVEEGLLATAFYFHIQRNDTRGVLTLNACRIGRLPEM